MMFSNSSAFPDDRNDPEAEKEVYEPLIGLVQRNFTAAQEANDTIMKMKRALEDIRVEMTDHEDGEGSTEWLLLEIDRILEDAGF